jgi:hypothetical protein
MIKRREFLGGNSIDEDFVKGFRLEFAKLYIDLLREAERQETLKDYTEIEHILGTRVRHADADSTDTQQ